MLLSSVTIDRSMLTEAEVGVCRAARDDVNKDARVDGKDHAEFGMKSLSQANALNFRSI